MALRGMKRVVASVVALAVGVGLLVGAFALPTASGAAEVRSGGTFKIDLPGIDYVDPALAYSPLSWQLLEATCAKLMNSPDRPLPDGLRVVPEVSAGYPAVSRDGKTYA